MVCGATGGDWREVGTTQASTQTGTWMVPEAFVGPHKKQGLPIASPLKVLHCFPWIASGGVEVAKCNLFHRADPSLWSHAVACFSAQGVWEKKIREAGIEIFQLCRKGEPERIWNPGSWFRLHRAIRHFQPNLITGCMFEGILQAHLMSWFHRIPFVVEDQFDPWGAGGRLGRFSYHLATRRCRLAISVSQRGAEYLRQVAGVPTNRIKTVYNPARALSGPSLGGLSIASLNSSSNSPRPWIGTVCRLDDSHKKVSDLLKAAQKLSPHIRVLIVGDGPDRNHLEQMARQSRPRLDTLFVGHQENPGPFLRAMEIFILPSAHDAMPLSLAEAMLQERCCVGSRVGGISEMLEARQDDDLGECGKLFNPGNSIELADTIRSLLNDTPTRLHLGQKARQRAHRLFAPASHAQEIELSYRQALGDRIKK